jgi:hypothetical protein
MARLPGDGGPDEPAGPIRTAGITPSSGFVGRPDPLPDDDREAAE